MPEAHCRDGTSTARNLEYATDGRVLPTGSNSKKGPTTLPNEPSVTPNLTSNLETYIETQVAFQGVAHTHTLEIRDRFGNLLDGYPTEDGFSATLVGTPDARAGILSTTEQNADSSVTLSTTVSNVTDASGKLLATFTPEVAGTYVMSNEYTGPGGLLATFFRTHDFTDAVLENSAHTTEVKRVIYAFKVTIVGVSSFGCSNRIENQCITARSVLQITLHCRGNDKLS